MAAEAEAAVAAREAADLAGATVAVLADEAVVAALALAAAAKAGRGSLRFRGSLGGRSGMSVPCGSGCGMRCRFRK